MMMKIRKLLHILKKIIRVKWIASAYLNFKLIPLPLALHFPIIVTGKLKIRSLSGSVTFKCPVRFGLMNIGFDVDNMPIAFLPTQLMIKGNLILSGDVLLNQGANLVVWPNATMTLGNDVMICSGVVLKSVNKVSIGNHVMISSGCFIMDSSIHCLYNTETLETNSPNGGIIIGDNVWLNMHTAIIKSGHVPNGCVTTQYAYIGKPMNPSDTNCLLSGQPAKIIKRNITQVHNFTTEKFINRTRLNHEEHILLNHNQIQPENLCRIITN